MKSKFVQDLNNGSDIITGWSSIPHALAVGAMLDAGYDTVTLDMQHGCHDVASVLAGIAEAKLTDKETVVRIPVGDWAMASRALDFGASAIIAPMINTVEDATNFVGACKYPPLGKRSWGPARAMQLHEVGTTADYLRTANDNTITFAMIETAEAFANLKDILAVQGIDGIFVGPGDLSVTLSEGTEMVPFSESSLGTIEKIAEMTIAANKIPAIFTFVPEHLNAARKMGYKFIALGADTQIMKLGAEAHFAKVRKS